MDVVGSTLHKDYHLLCNNVGMVRCLFQSAPARYLIVHIDLFDILKLSALQPVVQVLNNQQNHSSIAFSHVIWNDKVAHVVMIGNSIIQ